MADRLVENLWRLRRVPFLENAILARGDTQRQHEQASDDVLDGLLWAPEVEKKTWAGCATEEDALKRIGGAVHDARASNALIKLSTYETRFFRRVEGLLGQLDRLRARREADEVQKMYRAPGPLIDGEAFDAWTTSP